MIGLGRGEVPGGAVSWKEFLAKMSKKHSFCRNYGTVCALLAEISRSGQDLSLKAVAKMLKDNGISSVDPRKVTFACMSYSNWADDDYEFDTGIEGSRFDVNSPSDVSNSVRRIATEKQVAIKK